MKDFFKGVRKHIDRLDVGHLREQYKLVADELANTEMLLHALKEGFVRLDADGRVLQSNPAAKRLLGSEPADALAGLGLPLGKSSSREIKVELKAESFSDGIRALEALRKKVFAAVKQIIGLSPKITLVEPGSLPRSEGKIKRVIDNRK